MVGLARHVLDPIINVVGDTAVVRVIKDHQPGQQDRVLQSMHWQGHKIVAFPLVMQDQGKKGHHKDENDRAANDSIGNARVIEELVF